MTSSLETIYARRDLTGLQKVAFGVLTAHADNKGLVKMRHSELAALAGTDERMIRRSMLALQGAGLVSVVQLGTRGKPRVVRLHAA